jgi:hypothetical protein
MAVGASTRLQPLGGAVTVPVVLMLLAHRSASGERFIPWWFATSLSGSCARPNSVIIRMNWLTPRPGDAGELASGIAHEMNQPWRPW